MLIQSSVVPHLLLRSEAVSAKPFVVQTNISMVDALADYILKLSEAAATTYFAADRPLYEKYLADAAVLLALVVSGAEPQQINESVKRHERLWGHTWLKDEVFKKPADAFEVFKEQLRAI